jgi:hypothetical protein
MAASKGSTGKTRNNFATEIEVQAEKLAGTANLLRLMEDHHAASGVIAAELMALRSVIADVNRKMCGIADELRGTR